MNNFIFTTFPSGKFCCCPFIKLSPVYAKSHFKYQLLGAITHDPVDWMRHLWSWFPSLGMLHCKCWCYGCYSVGQDSDPPWNQLLEQLSSDAGEFSSYISIQEEKIREGRGHLISLLLCFSPSICPKSQVFDFIQSLWYLILKCSLGAGLFRRITLRDFITEASCEPSL